MPALWQVWPDERCLARDVRVARSFVDRSLGVLRDQPLAADDAVVLDYDDVARRGIHMLGVRQPLDVVWLADGHVVQAIQLTSWTGRASGEADMVVELPAGGAAELLEGHRLELRGGPRR